MRQYFVFRLDSFKYLYIKLSGVKTGWIVYWIHMYMKPISKCQVKYSSPVCYTGRLKHPGWWWWCVHVISSAKLRGSDKIHIYLKKGGGDLGKLNCNCLGDSVYFSVLHFPVLTKMSKSSGMEFQYCIKAEKKIGKKWKLLSLRTIGSSSGLQMSELYSESFSSCVAHLL